MTESPRVLLSAFADESAIGKTAVEQLAVMAALGLEYYSLRFVDVGGGIKNAMKLDADERRKLRDLHRQYDMKVATIGSPIGKVKLVDIDDGTKNAYVPFEKYLKEDVAHAIRLAHEFDTKLIRGFSFYPPRGQDVALHMKQAVDQIGRIALACQKEGVVFGLELEANLVGDTGGKLAEIARQVDNPALVLIFDGANLACQNFPAERCVAEYRLMRDGIGWMHVKDYRIDPNLVWAGHVDEERLKNFVPAGEGDSGYEPILRDFRSVLPGLSAQMRALGAPGVFLDLEPHVRGGGQFGGHSGPDGMGVSLRALCRLLDFVGIDYSLRDSNSLKHPTAL